MASPAHVEGRDRERGVTLVELLIAVTITSLILVTLGFAVTEGFRNTVATNASIDRSLLANFTARYFAADVASASFGSDSVKTQSTTPAARGCGTGTPVIDIQTSANTAVTYATVDADGRESFVRTVCSGTVSGPLTQTGRQHLGTTDVSLTANATCASATSCALTLTWTAAPTYSITLSGTRWVNATTTTTP